MKRPILSFHDKTHASLVRFIEAHRSESDTELEVKVNFGEALDLAGVTRIICAIGTAVPDLESLPDETYAQAMLGHHWRARVPRERIEALLRDPRRAVELSDTLVQKEALRSAKAIQTSNFKLTYHRETAFDPSEAVGAPSGRDVRAVRVIHRRSWAHRTHGLRLDVSAVRTVRDAVAGDVAYEVELEFDPDNRSPARDTAFRAYEVLVTLLSLHQGSLCPLTEAEQRDILAGFSKMAGKRVPRRAWTMPAPLTVARLAMIARGDAAYAVTEKADGERVTVVTWKTRVITLDGRGFAVDTGTTAPAEYDGTIVEAELVRANKQGSPYAKPRVLCFDVTHLRGERVTAPLLGARGRATQVRSWVDALRVSKESTVTFETKRHREPPTMKAIADTLDETFDHETDGLIFTPDALGGVPLKWKPPHLTTVDLLVRLHGRAPAPGPQGHLATLFMAAQSDPLDPETILTQTFESICKETAVETARGSRAVPRALVSRCVIPETAVSGELIQDDQVVEFSCTLGPGATGTASDAAAHDVHFVPWRVRADKTALYRSTKSIDRAANFTTTVRETLASIRQPVTESMLRGADIPDQVGVAAAPDAAYYSRPAGARDSLAMAPLMKRHGQFKHWLYGLMSTHVDRAREKALLEIGVGKAGDLPKWLRVRGLRAVVGVDPVSDNIMNEDDGAYARYRTYLHDCCLRARSGAKGGERRSFTISATERTRARRPEFSPLVAAFLTIDGASTKLAAPGPALVRALPKAEKRIAEHMLRIGESGVPLPGALRGVMTGRKFSVVSCQFALHYFFETPKKLAAFCNAVAFQLAPKGYFIGTYLDGDAVARDLGDEAEMSGHVGRTLVWKIARTFPVGSKSVYGRSVDVFLESTGAVHTEYLVDMQVLERRMAALGIFPVTEDSDLDLGGDRGFERPGLQEVTGALKRYSDWHRFFVFQKR